jgi:glutamate---cysteine ligase / carboxylate-amine ligase
MKPPSLTLGVEEEYQIINPETRNLQSHISRLIGRDIPGVGELKPELHQSIIEVATGVCQSPAEVRSELVRLRGGVMDALKEDGLTIAAAGAHPFANWMEQEITPLEHYIGVRRDMGDLAQRLLIFGMHVHVAIEDREFLVDAMNVSRYLLPHILALTTSSPFWLGRDTGLKSYRSAVFRGFPRTGIPARFTGWGEYQQYVDTMVTTGSIPHGGKIWWDVRPHHKFPTLEFRVCDICTKVDEAVCVAAIFQAMVFKLWKMRRDNITLRNYASPLIEENKWRAMRFGIEGKLIDFGREQELPAHDLIREMLDWFLGDAADELGTRDQINYAFRILEEGSSADRQLATFRRTNDLRAVVDQLVVETAEGVREPLRPQAREAAPDALTAARERIDVRSAVNESDTLPERDGHSTAPIDAPMDRRTGGRPGRRASDGFDMTAAPPQS